MKPASKRYRQALLLAACLGVALALFTRLSSLRAPCPAPSPGADPGPNYSGAYSHDPDFLAYADAELESAEGFKRDILLALKNMFVDLEQERQPILSNITHEGEPIWVHPISFSIPPEMIAPYCPDKAKHFGTIIPGDKSTYKFLGEGMDRRVLEHLYYEDMQRSFFALTVGKSGWDCMRHLEILASGCLPLFTDMDMAPPRSISAYPKRVFELLLQYPGLSISGKSYHRGDNFTLAFREAGMDKELYMAVVTALLHYTRTVLSTPAMARYLLQRVADVQGNGAKPAKKVLFLVAHPGCDYQMYTTLHGLKVELGTGNVIDPERPGVFKNPYHFSTQIFSEARYSMYGRGFSYGMKGLELPHTVNRENLTDRIKAQEFDLVVFGGAHMGYPAVKDLVCDTYDRNKVVMVWGNDSPLTQKHIKDWMPCAAHFFTREVRLGWM